MGDTLTTIIAIFLAVVLMFIFPMLVVSERSDDISQLSVETAVTQFVDDSRSVGKITMNSYEELVNTLNATGNTYEIDMEIKSLDENIGKKTAWTEGTVIGENVYYSIYTSQILETLVEKQKYIMKEGDIFSCSAKNTNTTVSQSVKSIFYSLSTNDHVQISAKHSGIVIANGN